MNQDAEPSVIEKTPPSSDHRSDEVQQPFVSPIQTTPKGPKQRTLVILGILASVLILVGIFGLAARRPATPSQVSESTKGLGAPPKDHLPTAPAAEVGRIEAALHDMGDRCKPSADGAAQRQIGLDVDQLIAFAKQYPDAHFTLDDENGSGLDLLLIARDEMRTCAPEAAARANQALPVQYRATASLSSSAPR